MSANSQAAFSRQTLNLHVVDRQPPGLSFTYSGDEDIAPKQIASRYAGTTFRHYLAGKMMQILVWDGESHMCLGVCDVELRSTLRRGKSAISFSDSVSIFNTRVCQRLITNEVADCKANLIHNQHRKAPVKVTHQAESDHCI